MRRGSTNSSTRSAASPSQVAALGRLSATTQSDASTLAGQLAQHAEALAAVGRDLARQQQSLDFALERRHSSLQALVGDLSGRSEAFEATLGRFAANVEDSFARSQARAQEISAALASATRGASIAVAGQFETIRDTAAKERERTTQTLQATVEQTNAQLTGALEHAADRFRQSVAEVKDMASQVQRELDQTRQELRRGVLDLPQETSETAEAMRRVVSDQIRALKELAALVSELGGDLTTSPNRSRRPPVAGARLEKPLPRAVESAREVEPASQSEAALTRVAEAIAAPATREPRQRRRIGAVGDRARRSARPKRSRGQRPSLPRRAGRERRPFGVRRRPRIADSRDGFRTCSRPPRATSRRRPRPKARRRSRR